MRAWRFAVLVLAAGMMAAGCSLGAPESEGAPEESQPGIEAPEHVRRGEEFTLRASNGWLIAGRATDAQHEDGSFALLFGEASGSGEPSARLEEQGGMVREDVADALVQELRYVFPETAKKGAWELCTLIVDDGDNPSEARSETVCIQLMVG